jgi:hypothetical protein
MNIVVIVHPLSGKSKAFICSTSNQINASQFRYVLHYVLEIKIIKTNHISLFLFYSKHYIHIMYKLLPSSSLLQTNNDNNHIKK